jgi:hypothetical protein
VTGCCKHGDEPSGFGATELVNIKEIDCEVLDWFKSGQIH